MRLIFIFLILSFFSVRGSSFSQELSTQLGLIFNVGSHVNTVGLSFQVSLQAAFVQANLFSSLHLNAASYGERKMFVENRSGLGLVLLGGKKKLTPDFQMDGLIHNSPYEYGLAYNYLIYTDNMGTSQLSGGWGVHLKNLSLLFENDVFGGQAKDRFRTGVFQISYRYEEWKFFANLYTWTGETKNSQWIKETTDGCPNGYRSLENLPFGKTSHGILSAGVLVRLPFHQVFTSKAGIDSEQIRHFIQNKLSHDLIFLPKGIPRHTPHYPRLNEKGQPVFNGRERKKDRPYIQVNINELWSN